MNTKVVSKQVLGRVLFVVVLLLAYSAIKFLDARELWFLLAPVSMVTACFTGLSFTFDSVLGFLCNEAPFAIAPSCSGARFLIIIALQCTLQLPRWNYRSMIAVVLGSYLLTIITSSFRIISILTLERFSRPLHLISSDLLHEMIGATIYLFTIFIVAIFIGKVRYADH